MKFENKYIVLKVSDLALLNTRTQKQLEAICDQINHLRNARGAKPMAGVFIRDHLKCFSEVVKLLGQEVDENERLNREASETS